MTTVSRECQVWGYARVGNTETGNLHQLIEQTCELTLAGAGINHLLFDIGSANAVHKPGFERLVQLVEAGVVDRVVVTRLDRLFRKFEDFTTFRKLLKDSQVELSILHQPQIDINQSPTIPCRLEVDFS